MRAFAFALALAFGALIVAGCHARPALPSQQSGYVAFTCEPDILDGTCVACLKARCCAQSANCEAAKDHCPCARRCLSTTNAKGCSASCVAPEEKAMADCASSSCASECPGIPL